MVRQVSRMALLGLSLLLWTLVGVSCGEKSSPPLTNGDHMLTVEMSYAPNPATVNTTISFKFEVAEDGEHININSVGAEVHDESGGHIGEIDLVPDGDDVGHYIGDFVFIEHGTYEIHFEYIHDGESAEEEFSIVVQ